MTVSYQYEVASSTSGGFTRLLFMWKGSLYKLIYRELFLFLCAFGILSALYRHAFTDEQKRLFEKVVVYCDTFINLIPLSFVLGFYVAYVAGRWWQQYMAIPWPDKIMHSIALYVTGNDEHGRMLRRTMMRYLNLTLILVLRSISSAVKRRFPTLDHLVEAGFMTSIELEMYSSVPSVEFNTYWIPCTWFISLLKETRKGSRITDAQGLKIIMEEFNEFRSKCGLLWSYDWVSLPLVYTQVVTIATYSFFLAALVGRQYVEERSKSYQMEVDIYVPVFTILQFFFYMGLLKVAEQLINPFGDDDEDFELNWLIDRHTKVSYLGVDILMTRSPPLVKDKYFDDVDLTLPYTEASVAYKKKTYRGSVHDMEVPEEKHTMFLPEITEEDEGKTPTPRGSIQNLQATTFGATATAASAAAAAAGIWGTQLPGSQGLYKSTENLENDCISVSHLEEGLVQPQEGMETEMSWYHGPAKECGYRAAKNLRRSDSAPGRKPSLVLTQWPSSSTVCKSDSFRSINLNESQLGTDSPVLHRQTTMAYENRKHHSVPGIDILNLRSVTNSKLKDPKFSTTHSRALFGKIRSLPKLMPIKRYSSMGSCSNNSKSKKGVRWKPMVDTSGMKDLDSTDIELDKLYFKSLSSKNKSRNNSLEVPVLEFPTFRTKHFEEPVYCDLCKKRVTRLSVSPNPDITDKEMNIKHSVSTPSLRYEQVEDGCGRSRSYSWQNRILEKVKFGTKNKEHSPSIESQYNSDMLDCPTYTSFSVPNIALWSGSSLKSDEESTMESTLSSSKEKSNENIPPHNTAVSEFPQPKTLWVPNPELQINTSSTPTSKKNSENSQDTSWKSTEWTLLDGNSQRS